MNRETTTRPLLLTVICAVLLVGFTGGISTLGGRRRVPMHKVSLTQRGYIQFLRWELPVPEIKEFTFCLWLRSDNLTYPHPIFSYSKDETDRLVRAWISPGGGRVHLEIGGTEVFSAASDIRTDRWYHVCQSWENEHGRYALWIDGQVRVQGQSEETTGHVIPSGGDIVVGQEYTDFDKGLEDGIEGAVLGFNLLLASSFNTLPRNYEEEATYDAIPEPSTPVSDYPPYLAETPMKIGQRGTGRRLAMPYALPGTPRTTPAVSGYRLVQIRRARQGPVSSQKVSAGSIKVSARSRPPRGILGSPGIYGPTSNRLTLDMSSLEQEPVGLQLVKLSYVRCEIGRGSPFIGGRLMLISWTRTPVRIFGGATVKNVRSDCGNF